jgi:hypothetical protein
MGFNLNFFFLFFTRFRAQARSHRGTASQVINRR